MWVLYTMVTTADVIKGAVLSPLLVFPYFIVATFSSELILDGLAGAFMAASLSLLVVYPVMLIYGVPLALLLNKFSMFKPQYFLLVGIVPGLLTSWHLGLLALSIAISLCGWWVAQRNANGV